MEQPLFPIHIMQRKKSCFDCSGIGKPGFFKRLRQHRPGPVQLPFLFRDVFPKLCQNTRSLNQGFLRSFKSPLVSIDFLQQRFSPA